MAIKWLALTFAFSVAMQGAAVAQSQDLVRAGVYQTTTTAQGQCNPSPWWSNWNPSLPNPCHSKKKHDCGFCGGYPQGRAN